MKLAPMVLVEAGDMRPVFADVDAALNAAGIDPNVTTVAREVRRAVAEGVQRIAEQAFSLGQEYGRRGAQLLDDPS